VKKKSKDGYSGIASRLKLLRSKLGYTQAEMGGRIGVSAGGYRKYEVGQRLPALPVQHRLVKEFDLSMDWLLFNKGPMYNKDKSPDTEIERRTLQLKQQLEQAQLRRQDMEAAHKKELEDLSARFHLPPELQELIDYMKKDDVLYHEILAYFKRFLRDGHEEKSKD
jgi:transcriptional regulator with XRE-family HTH domain